MYVITSIKVFIVLLLCRYCCPSTESTTATACCPTTPSEIDMLEDTTSGNKDGHWSSCFSYLYQHKGADVPEEPLVSTSTTYTGEQMVVAGKMEAKVRYGQQGSNLTLYVVEGDGPSLLGREWPQGLKPNWGSIKVAAPASGYTPANDRSPTSKVPGGIPRGLRKNEYL